MKHPYRPVRRKLNDEPPARVVATSRMPYRDGDRESPDMAMLNNAIAPLMEHFDTVQIIATRLQNDGTVFASRGAGNWYARMGSTREWFAREDESARCTVRGGSSKDDDDQTFSA